MNENLKLFRSVSIMGLFVLVGASFARADVTRLDEIAVNTSRPNATYTIVTWPSSPEFRKAGILSGCIGAYQAPVEAMVFHSVCQGINLLSELGQNEAAMAFRTPTSHIFGTDRAFENPFGMSRVTEMPMLRANSKFDVLEQISSSSGVIDARGTYSGAGSRLGTSIVRPGSAEESDLLALGEDIEHDGGDPEGKRHPGKDHDGDDDLAPEPSTLLLLGTGTFILGAVLRRRLGTVA